MHRRNSDHRRSPHFAAMAGATAGSATLAIAAPVAAPLPNDVWLCDVRYIEFMPSFARGRSAWSFFGFVFTNMATSTTARSAATTTAASTPEDTAAVEDSPEAADSDSSKPKKISTAGAAVGAAVGLVGANVVPVVVVAVVVDVAVVDVSVMVVSVTVVPVVEVAVSVVDVRVAVVVV